jgi:hypothetical protein
VIDVHALTAHVVAVLQVDDEAVGTFFDRAHHLTADRLRRVAQRALPKPVSPGAT